MLGQRFLPTSYQAKLQQMDYEKHMKRLETIGKPSKSVVEEKDDIWRNTYSDLKNKHQKFQVSEKLISIDKTNQNLLDKLVKISRNQKPPLFKTNTLFSHPGTLNTGFRKAQLEKIALENEAMAKRLISQQGSVNRRQLDKDFEKHQEFSKNVQKISSPKIDKLIPIRSPKTQETLKGFKVKKKRAPKKISASVQIDTAKFSSKPTEENQSKEHMANTDAQEETQENEAERLNQSADGSLNHSDDNNKTVDSKEVDAVKKEEPKAEAEAEAESKDESKSVRKTVEEASRSSRPKEETNTSPQPQEETNSAPLSKEESEPKEEPKAEEDQEKKEKPQELENKSVVQENKSQVLSNASKSGVVQPPSNFEKAKSARKESPNMVDSKDPKSKSSAREVVQIPTTRSKHNTTREEAQIPTTRSVDKSHIEKSKLEKSQVNKSQLDKSQVEESQVEKSQLGKPQVEESQVEKSQLEKSQVEKSHVEKSQLEKSQVEKSQVEKSQADKSQVEKSQVEKSQADKSQAEKSQVEKSQLEKSQEEKSQVEKSQADKSQAEKSQVDKSQAEKSQLERSTVKSVQNESGNASPVQGQSQSQRQSEAGNPIENQENSKSQARLEVKERASFKQPVVEEDDVNQEEQENVADDNQSQVQEEEEEVEAEERKQEEKQEEKKANLDQQADV